MSSLWLDVRYALRLMAKTPGLTAVLVVTLALGIGATTTIFSVVSSVLLRPLPYTEPDRLVRVFSSLEGKSGNNELGMLVDSVGDIERGCHSCAALGVWRDHTATLSGGDRAVRATMAYTTHQLWPLLGVRPLLGRWFDAADDAPANPQVIALGYDLWEHAFGKDPNVIGRKIFHSGKPVTVVAVMPPGFRFPQDGEAWLPQTDSFIHDDGGSFNLSVLIRLAPGASPQALTAELDAMAKRWTADINKLAAQIGLAPMNVRPVVKPLLADLVGELSVTLWLLQGAVLFVLLIAIVNVANLLLARAETRTREIAVRHALGASRRRLVRQLVTESLLLGLTGGGLGILVAMWALDAVVALIPHNAPRAADIALDARAVAFAVVCSVIASLVFGLAPILHARRSDLHGALKDGSPRMTGSKARLRVRRALVIGEISLAVVLVVGCTVMVRSFVALQQVDVGFDPEHVLTFGVSLPRATHAGERAIEFWRTLEDRLSALPGVRAVTMADGLPPFNGASGTDAIGFPGRNANTPGEPDWLVNVLEFTDEHLGDGLGARLTAGRMLRASDNRDAPAVALVNDAFVAKFFRGRDPIGQKVTMYGGSQVEMTVVGVVADIKNNGLARPAGTAIMLPLWQSSLTYPKMTQSELFVVVRTTGDPSLVGPAVQHAVTAIDPAVPVFAVQTMDQVMWDAVARPRLLVLLLSSFAGIALLLAAVGIYGVMAHTVAQRTHELGLRMALGARPAQVRAMVLRQASGLVAVGVAIGLIAAIVLSVALHAALSGVVFSVSLTQPVLYVAVALIVAATALIATWIPARRATLVQPTVALRSE